MIPHYQVIPRSRRAWVVRKPGATRCARVFDLRSDAVEWARERAERVSIHDLHGRIVRVIP